MGMNPCRVLPMMEATMCKIFSVAGIPVGSEARAERLVREAKPYLTERNRDGYGVSSIGRGLGAHPWGVRWIDVRDTVRREAPMPPEMAGWAYAAQRVSPFGTPAKGVSGIVSHARLATTGIALVNVHPLVACGHPGFALVHNGIVGGSASAGAQCAGGDVDSAGILAPSLRLRGSP